MIPEHSFYIKKNVLTFFNHLIENSCFLYLYGQINVWLLDESHSLSKLMQA